MNGMDKDSVAEKVMPGWKKLLIVADITGAAGTIALYYCFVRLFHKKKEKNKK